MATLAPSFSVSNDIVRGEIHYACSGFWTMETMVDFQRELIAAARPLFEAGRPIRSFADLRGFVAQTQEVSEAIKFAIGEAVKLGTVRSAILTDSMLTAMQYKRLNVGLEIELFEDKDEALKWLRDDGIRS